MLTTYSNVLEESAEALSFGLPKRYELLSLICQIYVAVKSRWEPHALPVSHRQTHRLLEDINICTILVGILTQIASKLFATSLSMK